MSPRTRTQEGGGTSKVLVEQVDEIVLDRVKVQVRVAQVPLDDVLLDPLNPRIANTVAASVAADDETIQKRLEGMLWDDSDVHSLYSSVLANKGLIERIILRSNGVVAEGNCRTVVYRRLREKFKDDETWRTIPARILPPDITDRQIAMLLGELHVGGKNEWSPFEKAGHMHQLFTQYGMVQDEIAKLLRTSKTSVNHQIKAFEALKNKYMVAHPGPQAVRKFSYFFEAYKNPTLREWFKNSDDALDHFVRWVGTNKIARGADVRELEDVIDNPRALAAFEKSGRDGARKILEQDRPELTSALFKMMVQMTAALEDARLDDVQRVRKDKSGGAKTIVRNLRDSLEKFVDLCDGVD